MDLASVVAALASVGVRVSGSAPNSSVQVDSPRVCPPGLAGPEPSGTIHDLGQHFHFLLHPPGGGHAFRTPATRLQQRKGRHHARTRPSGSPSSLASQIPSPAKQAGPTAGLVTTRMLTKNCPEYYHPTRASGVRAPRGPARTSSRKVARLGRRGGYGIYNLRVWYEGHAPRRKLTKSMSERGAATLPVIPILRNPNWGTRGNTGSPQGATPTPCQRARMCYAESNPPRRTERPGTTAQADLP